MPIYPTLQPHDALYARNPTGMTAIESMLWHQFRVANQQQMRRVYFNVHVGTVPGDDPASPEAERLLRAQLYAKRIDVIADAPPETWVIEIKPRINAAAIGQLQVYLPLVAARCPGWPRLRPILIGADMDVDAAALCAQLSLTCLTPPFGPLAARTTLET